MFGKFFEKKMSETESTSKQGVPTKLNQHDSSHSSTSGTEVEVSKNEETEKTKRRRKQKHSSDVAAVFSKVPAPAFRRSNLEAWFVQMESWFVLHSIKSDNIKFSAIVTFLDPDMVTQLHQEVNSPPDRNKYDSIKKAALRHFGDSDNKKYMKLLSGVQLGDKKPSHLLNELRKLGNDSVQEDLLKTVWAQRLPVSVRTILAATPGTLSDLAKVADAVIESLDANPIVAEVVSQGSSNSSQKILEIQIMELNKKFDRLSSSLDKKNDRSRSRSKSRSRNSNSRSNTPARDNDAEGTPTTCYYHRNYGMAARKCRKPCNFFAQSAPENQQN